MTKNDLITIPDTRLRQRSKRIGHIDQEILDLAKNMIEVTLDWEASRKHETAAALAAIQIAVPYRIIIVRNNFDDKDDQSFGVYINPEIVKLEGEPTEEMEGCLSVKDIYGAVARFPKVKVKALNLDGQPVRLTVTDPFLARVFQHEIDHTNGLVFVDRVDDPKKLFMLQDDGNFTPLGVGQLAK